MKRILFILFKWCAVIIVFSSLGCQGFLRPVPHIEKRQLKKKQTKKLSSQKKSLKKLTQKKQPVLTKSHYEKILAEVKKWDHTKYKWGGTTAAGLDCSGFVMVVFKNIYDIKLPRTTKSQLTTGIAVPQKSLNAGDLVFFQIYHSRRHVGIFLKNGKFAHVSTKKGVRISNINDDYWRRRYLAARRVL